MFRSFILTTLLTAIAVVSLQAQIQTERLTMSEGVYPALILDVPNLDDKVVKDIWADFTKDFYSSRTKYNRKTKEYMTEDAKMAAIGKGDPVNLYTRIEDKGDGSELTMWVTIDGTFLSAELHPDRYIEAEKMLMRFGLEAAKEKVRMDLALQEKALDRLEGDLKKLDGEKERYERDIERAQEAIRKAEASIEQNGKDQEAKLEEIEAQKEAIEAIKRKLNDL